MHTFETSLKAKLIYVFTIPDEPHAGCLKVGEATFYDDKGDTEHWPLPNSEPLNRAARERINQYTGTAGIAYGLLHTEIALYKGKDDHPHAFRDYDVHRVLERSGIKKKAFPGVNTKSQEWFCCDLATVQRAIQAVKAGEGAVVTSTGHTPIIFRPEQQEAIQRTVKRFRKAGRRMLWNAKMRFGKTLTALQVARERNFRRTLIITHRPVVSEGWFEDFDKIFYDRKDYRFGSRSRGESPEALEQHAAQGGSYVFFASIQDLRGSEQVGGKFDKNDRLFRVPWDYLIVDEAHEGTQTERGEAVIQALIKPDTCVLQLSGTPFNLLPKYDEKEVFTWDYVMEQRAKMQWDMDHLGDEPNPYEALPAINIYTYDLGRLLQDYLEDDEDRAFNFREFFRTRGEDGRFVHEDHIDSFLHLLCRDDPQSLYPYSRPEYRDIFRHTLWMLPGVQAARALSQKLREHPVFSQFQIVNVAGDGDDDEERGDALQMVKQAIGRDPDETYTITLSCGRLTTGVSMPPWTGVFMMAGTYKSTATAYMQTIFRVQTPYTQGGRMKTICYAFDFAPDRTLTVLAETAKVSAKVGKQTDEDRRMLADFLNFCPVIAIDGSRMLPYDVDRMMGQLKKAEIERVVNRGFEDGHLYNDELYKLDEVRLKDFEQLQSVIGKTKALPRTLDIDVNRQGLTNEQYAEIERIEKKKKQERTPEEEEMLRQREEQRQQRARAISILRGISIRMPLMLYGADIKDEDRELTIDNFTALVDDRSWEEFMPRGVTKELFERFKAYYDPDVFREAGKRIRRMARAADRFTVEERIERITAIFSTFRNPDKETVLTPWRVVNLHLSRTLGGYTFFDADFERELSAPRHVDIPGVTADVFRTNSLILEINSKSGLYPLYAAYSIYRARLRAESARRQGAEVDDTIAHHLWDATLQQNILVLCKTPMAVSITRRTLAGFRPAPVNARDFPNLIQELINNPAQVAATLRDTKNFWHLPTAMKIDAVIGNPPYQVMDGGGANTSAISVYNYFMELSKQMRPTYISLIMPARWYTGGKGLDEFREKMLNDSHFRNMIDHPNPKDCFPSANVSGGICYFLWDRKYDGMCNFENVIRGKHHTSLRRLNEYEVFVRYNQAISIIRKVTGMKGFVSLTEIVSARNSFGLESSIRGEQTQQNETDLRLYSSRGIGWIDPTRVTTGVDLIEKHKVFMGKVLSGHIGEADADGQVKVIASLQSADPGDVCTDSYLLIGEFDSSDEAKHLEDYLKSKMPRFLLLQSLTSMNISRGNFRFVPLLDFSKPWTDKELYKRYNLSEEEIAFIEQMIKPMV